MMSGTVLVVADSQDDRARLEQIVSYAGCQVYRSCSGTEVLDGPFESPPDFVLLDVAADDMDGFQVCRALSSRPAMRDVPVIVFSDEINVDHLWAEQQGASGVVTKPYTLDQVVDLLRRLGRR